MAAKINLKITGVRGGSPSYHENKGRVTTFVDNGDDYIAVDAFEGMDKTYKRREKCEIEISIGKTTWRGTKDELVKLLAPKSKQEQIEEVMGQYISEEPELFPKIIAALKKALKKSPDKMVDEIEIDKGSEFEVSMESIDMWQPVEYTFTVKQFCELVGIE
jgi:hypothetical protein